MLTKRRSFILLFGFADAGDGTAKGDGLARGIEVSVRFMLSCFLASAFKSAGEVSGIAARLERGVLLLVLCFDKLSTLRCFGGSMARRGDERSVESTTGGREGDGVDGTVDVRDTGRGSLLVGREW